MIAAWKVPPENPKREYIEREAAKMAVVEALGKGHSPYNAIVMLPAADVRPVKRGRWAEHYETYDHNPEWGEVQYGYICSLCGRWEYEREPFCNCGAEMSQQDDVIDRSLVEIRP